MARVINTAEATTEIKSALRRITATAETSKSPSNASILAISNEKPVNEYVARNRPMPMNEYQRDFEVNWRTTTKMTPALRIVERNDTIRPEKKERPPNCIAAAVT